MSEVLFGKDVFSVLHYSKAHCLPDCKSRGKLKEKGVRIPGTGSVFQNIKFMARWQSVYALDCKPGRGRLNSYPGLQVLLVS